MHTDRLGKLREKERQLFLQDLWRLMSLELAVDAREAILVDRVLSELVLGSSYISVNSSVS